MSQVENRLAELGLTLPADPQPIANYVVAKAAGELVFVSGQVALENGAPIYCGKVGDTISLDDAYQSARLSALRCIAALKAMVGDLDRVEIVKVVGFVNAIPEFQQQPQVINGASDLLVEAFGPRGRHARSAIGVGSLPANCSVEVELIARICD